MQATEDGAKPVDLEAPIGRLSRIDAIQAQKLTQANRARTQVRLRHVMAALGSIRDHEFGDCRKCGDPISTERLNAVPESPLCLPCMEKLESGRK
jgi:DnaK suppressor protein